MARSRDAPGTVEAKVDPIWRPTILTRESRFSHNDLSHCKSKILATSLGLEVTRPSRMHAELYKMLEAVKVSGLALRTNRWRWLSNSGMLSSLSTCILDRSTFSCHSNDFLESVSITELTRVCQNSSQLLAFCSSSRPTFSQPFNNRSIPVGFCDLVKNSIKLTCPS